jgi:transketolase
MNSEIDRLIDLSKKIKLLLLNIIYLAKAAHIGSSLSFIDILVVLYGKIMNINPSNTMHPERDKLIISKGHAAAGYYSTLAVFGFISEEELKTYCEDGTLLGGHVTKHGINGVELSTGSLGHGLPVGCGFAIADKYHNRKSRTFVILSDGECDEGSNWEAILFASQHKLDNLVVIIDYNKIQSFGTVNEVLNLEPFANKLIACNWCVKEIDGHSYKELLNTLSNLPDKGGQPIAIIAHTIKGKGISFMENKLLWHYRSPDQEQYEQALSELRETK